MSIQIIPSVLEQSKSRSIEAVKKIKTFSSSVQIDVCDGIFSDVRTLQASDFSDFDFGNLIIEVHLMVQNPESVVDQWLDLGAKKIIVHAEAHPSAQLLQRVKSRGAECYIASRSHASLEQIEPYIHLADGFLFLSIDPPGHQGLKFQPSALELMKQFNTKYPGYLMEADGAISPENVSTLIRAGVTQLVVGSWLFSSSKSPEERYNAILSLAQAESRAFKNVVQ